MRNSLIYLPQLRPKGNALVKTNIVFALKANLNAQSVIVMISQVQKASGAAVK
jgi:hypothetical protein